jgi:hypothetical protein
MKRYVYFFLLNFLRLPKARAGNPVHLSVGTG